MDTPDPRQLLARRLRSLREERWPDKRITQQQLAQAIGVSVPLISSWESQTNPRLPPLARLEAYTRLFASTGTFDAGLAGGTPALTDPERQAANELRRELMQLRNAVMQAGHAPAESAPLPANSAKSISSGPWRFDDGGMITIVCAQLPQYMLDRIPYTDVDDPDYIELLTYSELDSLFELHGHIRASNPESLVVRRIANTLGPDEYHSHLAVLGGVDWNAVTKSILEILEIPVRQIADWSRQDGQYFEVDENGSTTSYRPVLKNADGRSGLTDDVALFVRAKNPFNRERTATICTGMYGRGTYGVVRALTDASFRDRNAEYLSTHFGADYEVCCILTRVPVIHGATLTPDWSLGNQTLFEWSR
ncbi:MAG TPA: helix-turn-helix transcriptional regulator [Streptosporangiaceae bacterium]|nr:helix-turn-helix transcriptional regulator [Streptosporangiaceae bacterium]